MTYLQTLRSALMADRAAAVPDPLWLEVAIEIKRATTGHGPFTTDPFRALGILGEEYGEVCRAVLEWRRSADHQGPSDKVASAGARGKVRAELVQLMAVAAMMFRNFEER